MAAWHLGKMGPSHVSDPLDWGVAVVEMRMM